MTTSSLFTVTNLTAATSKALFDAGFREVSLAASIDWKAAVVRVYEDEYSIVCVAIYETWADLDSHWMLDQANLIDLMSKNIVRADPKSWEGYIILLTPSIVPSSEREKAILIQRDTRHVRKLFADGGELNEIDDVARLLLPAHAAGRARPVAFAQYTRRSSRNALKAWCGQRNRAGRYNRL